MDTLIVNSYAGSLVLGAKAAGLPIRGSYEDANFGIAAQKLNFPELTYVDQLPWPEDDLKNTLVIAHPPCASFSRQNSVKDKRGTSTDGFECHRRAMKYAMGNGCLGLAIESVTGALTAADSYSHYAKRFGYHHFFILLNSISFGVPQWRARLWVLFFRDDAWAVKPRLRPVYRSLGDILEAGYPEPMTELIEKRIAYFMKRFDQAGFDFNEYLHSEEIGRFQTAVPKFLGIQKDGYAKATGTEGVFTTRLPLKLDLSRWAPVILEDRLFYINERPMTRLEYQRVMGFPDDFQWPPDMLKKFLAYLSKGVCPPVATWIVKYMKSSIEESGSANFAQCMGEGEVLDLQPKQAAVLQALASRQSVLA